MSTDLVVMPSATLMPVMSIQQAAERHNMLVEYTKSVMVRDQDFGVIPGVSKPCLYKAGAEKLLSLFGFSPSFSLIERVEDWTGKDHGAEPFFYYFYKCQLLRGGEILGEGDGSCNSWEKKYRYRNGDRKCPQCGKPTIIVGKQEYGGGFICFAKKGGCGAKFGSKDPSITGQDTGQVPNPDIAEQVNTLQKMAQKRALVAAVLIACNASAFYTQDVEDMQTIDVTPTETRDEVVERRLSEERAKATTVPPAVVIELANSLDQAPELKGPMDVRQGTTVANERAEPPLMAPDVKKPPKKAQTYMSESAKLKWKQAKLQLNAVRKDNDKFYYDAIAPYKHCTHIPTKEEADMRWKILQSGLTPQGPPKHDFTLEEELHRHKRDNPRFIETLGAHGFESVADVIERANGTQTGLLLSELRQK